MRPALALLALAVVALTARRLRRLDAEDAAAAALMASQHARYASEDWTRFPLLDDSEVVGMPTTWNATTATAATFGPGWYVELAPSSRN